VTDALQVLAGALARSAHRRATEDVEWAFRRPGRAFRPLPAVGDGPDAAPRRGPRPAAAGAVAPTMCRHLVVPSARPVAPPRLPGRRHEAAAEGPAGGEEGEAAARALGRLGPPRQARSICEYSQCQPRARRALRPNLLRRVGPQHARDLGLRAEVDCTEASKSAAPFRPAELHWPLLISPLPSRFRQNP
jgi:hypothetical protein